jgi:hypothetical protein
MKAFVFFAVALAVLCVVSAQKFTETYYLSTNCTGPIRTDGPTNPNVQDVGVCIIPENKYDPQRPPPPAESFKFVCDGKTATQTGYLPDTGKNTSSCQIVDPTKLKVEQLNTCVVYFSQSSQTNRSYFVTCTMPVPGATISTSGSGSINNGFLAFSFFLTSVVAAFLVAL